MQKVAALRCRGLSVSQAAVVQVRPNGLFVELETPLPVGTRLSVAGGGTTTEARVAEVVEQDPSGKATTGMLLAWIGPPIAVDAFPDGDAVRPDVPPKTPEPTVEAPKAVAEPPKAVVEPPKAVVEPPKTLVEPPKTVEPEALKAVEPEPPKTLVEPPKTVEPEPQMAVEARRSVEPPVEAREHHKPAAMIVEDEPPPAPTPPAPPPEKPAKKKAAVIVEDPPELFADAATPLVIGSVHEPAEPTIRTEAPVVIDAMPTVRDDEATVQVRHNGAPVTPMDEGDGQTTRFVISKEKEEKKGKKSSRRKR